MWKTTRPALRAGRAGRSLASLALAVLAAAPGLAEEASPAPGAPLSLAWCLERAEAANPWIDLDRANAEAASHRVATAGAWEDPRLSYEASNVPIGDWDFDSTPLSGHQIFLAQQLPFPGLLGTREGAAQAGADAARLALDDRRARIAGAAESAWAELGFAQRALEITDRNIELLRQLTTIAEARYRVGVGLQQDVLRAQVELTALLQERLRREAAIRSASAGLAAVLDLPPETGFPVTAALEEDAAAPDLEALLAGLDESPRLGELATRVEEARREQRASELEGYPDFDLRVGYRARNDVSGDPVDGDDFVSAGVIVRLPVDRRRWRARVAERGALVRRAEARYRGARAELQAGIRAAHAELVRAASEAALLETGLVPQARQSLESSRSGYEVGRVDFPSLVDSQVRLLDAELRRVRAVADHRGAWAALEVAAGRRLR